MNLGAAADECEPCERQKIEHWPICSPKQIEAASMATPLMRNSPMEPWLKAGTFAREAVSPLPGRAQLDLSGLINVGGASCAGHIAKVLGEDGIRRSGTRQKMTGIFESMGDAMRQMDSEDAPASPQQLQGVLSMMDSENTAGDAQEPHVVLQIYTPNIVVQQTGMLALPNSHGHDGVGGWRTNGYANLVLQLPDTRPEDLEAGQSYPAVARDYDDKGMGGQLYMDWHGQFVPYYRDVPAPLRAANKSLNRKLAETTAGLKQELGIGDEALRGPKQLDFSRGHAFRGTQRHVDAARLKGSVTIDRVSKGSISGHFEVKGVGQLHTERYSLDYDSDGQLVGDREVDSQDTESELQASGRFQAPNYRTDGNVPYGTPVVVSGEGVPDEQELLHVTGHSPAIAERNVDWKNPQICVTFDAEVDMGSFNDRSFYVEYRDDSGQLQQVAAYYRRAGPRRVRLAPLNELKDGVRYRVRLKAGDDGVRGREGQPLNADYGWNFYTTVDLDDREPMPELSRLVKGREGIEPHVFQVARDTRLVEGKPTLARVYTKWRERDDVAENWQVKRFEAEVRIHENSDKGPVIARKKAVILRPDQYTSDQKRMAANTVNLFDVDMSSTPGAMVVEIEPETECDDDRQKFFSHPKPLEYSPLKATLNVTYYFIPVGEWRNGIPPMAQAVAGHVVASAARFATQNMPVLGVNMRSGGVMPLSEDWKESVQTKVQTDPESARLTLMHMLEDRMSTTDARRSDIIIGLMPYSLFRLGGSSYENGVFDDSDPSQFPIPAVAMSIKPVVARLAALTHEFGHVFGLEHVPPASAKAERTQVCSSQPSVAGVGVAVPGVPIQGFRMTAGGHDGANKSVVEGNAQSTLGLLPLMFPCMGGTAPIYADKQVNFISDDNYKRLLTNMARYQSLGLFARHRHRLPLLLAANSSADTAGPTTNHALAETAAALRPPARGLLVAGMLPPDGDARIDWVRRYSGHPRKPADEGEWRLEAIGPDGAILGQQRFTHSTEDTFDPVFRIALDGAQAAAGIKLYHRDKQVAQFTRSDNAPDARITGVTPTNEDQLAITWASHDEDGDTLTHRLLYAPSEQGPWIALTGRDPSQRITIERRLLAPGPSPTLKLIASDGFNETVTTQPIRKTANLHVLARGPAGEDDPARVKAANDDIYAVFNSPLAAGTLTPETFTLENPAGEQVAARLEYRATDRTATLSPEKTLTAGTVYTATLAPRIADRYGNTLGEPLTWRFIRQARSTQRSISSPDSDTSPTHKETSQQPVGSESSQSQEQGQDEGKATLDWAGKSYPLRIEQCSRTSGLLEAASVIARTTDDMRLRIGIIGNAGGSQHTVVLKPEGEAGQSYTAIRKNTGQDWTDTVDDTPADGPLVEIQGNQLTIDADLVSVPHSRERKPLYLRITCPGLDADNSANDPE